MDLSPARLVSQWNEAQKTADQRAKDFMEDVVMKFEAAKTPYVLIGYSLGTRVIAEALEHGTSQLQYLRGVYFLGAALPCTYVLDRARLPGKMKVTNYYSPHLDEVLKLCFATAEGVKAGGEIGFADTAAFENYRTVCTHVHKGGPIQRDYSNLAPAIAYLTLFGERILLDGKPPRFNREAAVGPGALHWSDIALFEAQVPPILIQQNVNTRHFRAVALQDAGARVRKAWGRNLHTLLRQLQLFPAPYARTVKSK